MEHLITWKKTTIVPSVLGTPYDTLQDPKDQWDMKALLCQPEPSDIKLFTAVIMDVREKLKVFVLGKPFQPNFMFVGKARSLPKSWARLWPFSQTLDKAEKACNGKTL
jgi:hypothetical protein